MSRRSLSDNVIQVGTLQPSGQVSNVKVMKQSDIVACPYVIFNPEHYREDGSCRCDDPKHKEMAEWGLQVVTRRKAVDCLIPCTMLEYLQCFKKVKHCK